MSLLTSAATFEFFPQFIRAFAADAGQKLHEALETQFVARVGDELEIRGHVLDVRLLEKTNPAGDAERDVATREFELKFERVEVRTVKHGHLVQVRALVAEFEDALGDEGGLLRG